jgi:hypothetical protein
MVKGKLAGIVPFLYTRQNQVRAKLVVRFGPVTVADIKNLTALKFWLLNGESKAEAAAGPFF